MRTQYFPGIMSEDLDVHEIETYVTVTTPERYMDMVAMTTYHDDFEDDHRELNFN